MLCANAPGVGESRLSSEAMSEDSAPVVETDPTSSWLKSAMQFTFPSAVEKEGEEANVAIASKAANLWEVSGSGMAAG